MLLALFNSIGVVSFVPSTSKLVHAVEGIGMVLWHFGLFQVKALPVPLGANHSFMGGGLACFVCKQLLYPLFQKPLFCQNY